MSGAFDRDAVLTMEQLVEVTPVVPIADAPCNLCQINQGSTFKKINHALESTATRTGTPTATPNAEGVPLARKSIYRNGRHSADGATGRLLLRNRPGSGTSDQAARNRSSYLIL